ncbi:MAG: U32 family peptidase C-terminal domain-containing protein [Patescibacteria group bacterium]
MKNKKLKPELLAPAGNLDILKMAFLYGADAVYCGTPDFAMRSRVGFSLDSLKEGIEYAHSLNKKVFVTLNAFPHALEIGKAKKHIKKIIALNPDALIVADPGIISFVRSISEIPIHLSTQANTTNALSAEFWRKLGVDRVVLARELNLLEINEIRDHSEANLEVFIHGAMCMAYSGRCQISNYLTGRDPNRGQCIQACRFKYKLYGLEEDLRKDEFFPILEDEEGTHILNSKDLCMIDHLDDLVKTGVMSLKIEGRLKSEYYVATVVKAYREALDLLFDDPSGYQKVKQRLFSEVSKSANRGFTTGFYYDKPNQDTNNYASSKALSEWGYIGRVTNYEKTAKILTFECKNYLRAGADLEIITPSKIYRTKLEKMLRNGEEIDIAHAGNMIDIKFGQDVPKDALIRVKL